MLPLEDPDVGCRGSQPAGHGRAAVGVTERKGSICLCAPEPDKTHTGLAKKKVKVYLRKWHQAWRHG